MSRGNTIDFRAFVENHPKSALKKPDVQPDKVFSPEWKWTCLRILKIYRKEQCKRLKRKKFGWLATRDAIMEDFDAKSGRKLAGRDPRLNYDHMKDWARNSTIPDSAFRYVDRFIRSMEKDDAYRDVLAELIDQDNRTHAKAFSEVYQRRSIKDGFVESLGSISGEFLYSDPLEKAGYQHIVMRIIFVEAGVLKVHVAYCDFDIHQPDYRNIHAALFYEGFLIPVPRNSTDHHVETGLQGRTDSWVCWVKLHRPQYRGSLRDGNADGSIEFGFLELPGATHSFTHIHLTRPNTLVWPTGEVTPLDRDEKEHHDKVKLHNDQKNNGFLAEIFNKGYKGYLF